MSDPDPTLADQPRPETGQEASDSPSRPEVRLPRLTDLIDTETLQAIQDGFAELTHAATSIRDEQGRLLTHPSCSNRFCELVGGPMHDNEACRLSNYAAAAAAAEHPGEPVKYICHAGLLQFAAAIHLDGRILGTIVLGDVLVRPLTRQETDDLARLHGVDADELAAAAAELRPVTEQKMQSATRFLQLLANTLTRLCWQQALLKENVNELTLLAETSRILSSTLDLDEALRIIVRTMADVMQVKACSLRLLNETGDELVIKAAHGLSSAYLRKGRVVVAENPNDQAALRGEIIHIRDMRSDPRVRYSDAARQEGLISSLAVGLVAKGKPLGTLHIYTSRPHTFSPEDVRLFRAVADQAALTVHNAQLVEEVVEARQQQRELAVAAKVQQRLLPAHAPAIAGYDLYGITVPSAMVGGDFHDWIELPGKNWGIAVGDVAGKGVPGAILMASIRAALRAQAQHIYALDHILGRVNESLTAETEVTEFVTLFYGVLDTANRRLTYSNAGHEPPVLVRDGKPIRMDKGGPILGVKSGIKYEYEVVDMVPGDTLIVYSDGACDAANFQGERFGRQRLLESILRHARYSAQRTVEEIHWDIRRFTGLAPRADDLTLLCVRVL